MKMKFVFLKELLKYEKGTPSIVFPYRSSFLGYCDLFDM